MSDIAQVISSKGCRKNCVQPNGIARLIKVSTNNEVDTFREYTIKIPCGYITWDKDHIWMCEDCLIKLGYIW